MDGLTRPVLTTRRLRLEPLTVDHIEDLVDLDSDPEVLRFIFGRALTREEVLGTWMPRRLSPEADARGLGFWVGHAEDRFVGWWCLAFDPALPDTAELGYRLRRDAWGRGYATEGARALLDHAFTTIGLPRVWAETMAVNAGSRNVMAKLGMRHVRSEVRDWEHPLPGADLGEVIYEITPAEFRRAEAVATWNAEAEGYDEPADHGLADPAVRDAWRSLLLGVLPPAPGRVADLGCGTGSLSLLLAEAGYVVDGLDLSPAMVEQALAKTAGRPEVTVRQGDASEPTLAAASYDVVLCRHVLWAMPDPGVALDRWLALLRPAGRLVLVEGKWSTGAGLTSDRAVALVRGAGLDPTLTPLDDPALWGGPVTDHRYLVTATT